MPLDETEIYPLFVNDTAKLSDRRQSMNALYLSVNSLLLGAVALLAQLGGLTNTLFLAVEVVVATAGIIIAGQWRRLIDKYRALLALRYKLLVEMENMPTFPGIMKVYTRELLANQYGFSEIERRLPLIFQWIYGIGTIGLLTGAIFVHVDVVGAFMRLAPLLHWLPLLLHRGRYI